MVKIKKVRTTKRKIKEEPANKSGFKYLKVYYKGSVVYDYHVDLFAVASNELLISIISVSFGTLIYKLMKKYGTNTDEIESDIDSQKLRLDFFEQEKKLKLTKQQKS